MEANLAEPTEADPDVDPLEGLAEREQIASANGIEIAYDELGDPDGEPLVLIMGLGTQLIHWDVRFCKRLAEQGFRVIRHDNRDCGHSEKLRGRGRPNMAAMLLGIGSPAYRLADMAADTVGLLDHLEISRAHIVGASMGGMIAQTVAIEHPERVSTLTSIMSTTGSRRMTLPRLRALGTLLSRPPQGREAYAEAVAKTFEVIGSPGYPRRPDYIRALALAAYDRCFYPSGTGRQLHAITSSGDRTAALRRLQMPAAVIHGSADPLVRTAAGRATAKAIPGAGLTLIEGMGHDLPPGVWPRVIDAITRNAARRPVAAPSPA
jgi:pimeloyl-ACP methyl ester carboxylesterase